MLHAELPDVGGHVVEVDQLLLQDVLEEHNDHAHRSDAVYFVFALCVALALCHTIFEEQLDELLREVHILRKTIEHFEQGHTDFHMREHIVVLGDFARIRHAD